MNVLNKITLKVLKIYTQNKGIGLKAQEIKILTILYNISTDGEEYNTTAERLVATQLQRCQDEPLTVVGYLLSVCTGEI